MRGCEEGGEGAGKKVSGGEGKEFTGGEKLSTRKGVIVQRI